jgi:hypothetical protein
MRTTFLKLLTMTLLAGPVVAEAVPTLTPIGSVTVDSIVYNVSMLADVSTELQSFDALNPSITFATAESAAAARDALVSTFGLGFNWNSTCTFCFDGVRVVFGFDAVNYQYVTASLLGTFGPFSRSRTEANAFSIAQFTRVQVPEAGTLALLYVGLTGLALSRRRKSA